MTDTQILNRAQAMIRNVRERQERQTMKTILTNETKNTISEALTAQLNGVTGELKTLEDSKEPFHIHANKVRALISCQLKLKRAMDEIKEL